MYALPIGLAALALAFCGVTYEFVLAQTLSVLLGNSTVQYSVTIGIFLAAMGFGSFLADGRDDNKFLLFKIQVALTLTAPAVFFALWLAPAGGFGRAALWAVAATAIALIGALAGAELPLLMAWAGERGRFKVLALDYLGMVLACLAFPLLFLPELGLFGTLLLTAALNAVIALILSPSRPLPGRPALVAWVVVLVFLLQKEEAIRQCLSQIFVHTAL